MNDLSLVAHGTVFKLSNFKKIKCQHVFLMKVIVSKHHPSFPDVITGVLEAHKRVFQDVLLKRPTTLVTEQ